MALTIKNIKLLKGGVGSSNFRVSGIGRVGTRNEYPTPGYSKPYGPEYGKAGSVGSATRKFKPASGDSSLDTNPEISGFRP